MKEAMNLTDNEVEGAARTDIYWRVGEYYISARNFAHHESTGTWITTLYAVPVSAGTHHVGWSNIPIGDIDSENWYFRPRGTKTIITPNAAEQTKILEAIEDRL